MPNYRRGRMSGGTWFFTVALADRRGDGLARHIEALRQVVRHVRERHPFRIDAMVVLPEHLHAVWTLPEGDGDYATRWTQIKAGFSRTLPAIEWRSPSRCRRRERGVWQRRFWEHYIRDEHDFANHVAYTHFNPVKHGLVERASDWPWSSLHAYVRRGWCNADWAASPDVETMCTGE